MNNSDHNLSMFIEEPESVYEEVLHIISLFEPNLDVARTQRIFFDSLALFRGEYEGYRACNTGYHDLDHTISVFLATARLLHASTLKGTVFTPRGILLGLAGALFHDAGFIQTELDQSGTGAKFTIGHEERSIEFIRQYLPGAGFELDDIRDCALIIGCTVLRVSPSELTFYDEETELLGKIVGTADLLAQMADRHYLEKLLFLYREFEEACIPGFGSEFDLLQKTESFYKVTTTQRLKNDLGDISGLMHLHFNERWGVDQDLYQESIEKNISYLSALLSTISDDFKTKLRRGGIVEKLQEFDE